jgi:exosortase O
MRQRSRALIIDSSVWLAVLTVAPAVLLAIRSRPVFAWFKERWTAQPDLAPLFLLLLAGTAWRMGTLHRQGALRTGTCVMPLALFGLVLGASVLNRQLWALGSLDAVLTLAAAFCLLSLHLPARERRPSTGVFLLLCLSLPVQDHLQDVAGFPFRVLTARVVANLMSVAGVPSLSDASLVMSSGTLAAVDYPCSGLRFLHVGTLLFTALLMFAHISRLRAALAGLGFLAALVLLNVWRVFSLVYLSSALGLRERAEAIHAALGVVGFATCCAVLVFVLRPSLRPPTPDVPDGEIWPETPPRAIGTTLATLGLLAAMSLDGLAAGAPAATGPPSPRAPSLTLPGYAVHPLALADSERNYYAQRGVETALKFQLVDDRTRSRSTLLLTIAASWYLQHAPERCVRGSGHAIAQSDVIRLAVAAGLADASDPFLVRRLVLDGGESSLFYWFTDGERALADYGARVWGGLRGPPRRWALVQVAMVGTPEPHSARVASQLVALERAARQLLAEARADDGD